jgi:ubiquinone/menaquinone biosynthesis C-methylase UbiE
MALPEKDFLQTTQESYNLTAKDYAEKVSSLSHKNRIDSFVQKLPTNAKIIDIGCGSGRDAKIFTEKGIKVAGIDFSSELLEIAKKTAPLGTFYELNMEELSFFPSHSFDGAWASASFLHIPKKKIPKLLATVHSLLKPNGFFYLSVKKGTGESFEKDMRYGGVEKFWSYFEEKEIVSYLENENFTILEVDVSEKKQEYNTHPFIHITATNVSFQSKH